MTRIALTGSAGVGKSTLGRALAERLDLPYLDEAMRRLLEGGLDLHALTRAELRGLLSTMWEERAREEEAAVAAHGGFVADRCCVDWAAFWLYYGFTDEHDRPEDFVPRMRRAARGRYDLVVVLPWGGIPLVHDGVRSPNRWKQLHFQGLLEGLMARFLPTGVPAHLPLEVTTLPDRVDWVCGRLAGAAGAAPGSPVGADPAGGTR